MIIIDNLVTGCQVGHHPGDHSRVQTEGAVPGHAGNLHQGNHPGQAGAQESLRVPGVHNQGEGTHSYLDIQPEIQGETCQMGSSWCGSLASNLIPFNNI